MEELLNTVKKEVEQVYGSSISYAKDCQLLADDISLKSNRQISTSTLKRFFGIINSSFKPSAYTLDTLSIYIGYNNWKDYVNSFHEDVRSDGTGDAWKKLAERVDLISNNTIDNLKRKIGYEKEKFIGREYLDHIFSSFYEGDEHALLFVAPDGYGKSSSIIQFNNWIKYHKVGETDITCIIEGSMFYHKMLDEKNYDLSKQLLEFDLNKSLNEYFRSHRDQIKGRFFIVIDDVDEVFLDKEKYHFFVENIFKILQAYSKMPWFKMILTCRPENLKPFDYFLKKNPILLNYFSNVFREKGDRINIPLFSDRELKELIRLRGKGIDLSYLRFFYSDILNLVRYPVFADVILDSLATEKTFSEIDLINRVVTDLLYSGPYGEEKYAIIESFLNSCQLGRIRTTIAKNELIHTSSEKVAYKELLGAGVLCEKVVFDVYLQKTNYVEFAQNMLLDYLIAINWVKKYDLGIELFKVIEDYYSENNSLRCSLFKWLVKLVFKSDNIALIKDLHTYTEASCYEVGNEYILPCYSEDMATAVKLKMRQNKAIREELLPWFTSSKLGRQLYFENSFDLDALMLYDITYLDDYLMHCINCESKISAIFLKFMHAFFDNDFENCKNAYEQISSIEPPDANMVSLYFRYFTVIILYKDKYENRFPHETLNRALGMLQNGVTKENISKIYIRLIFILYFTSEPGNLINIYSELLSISDWARLSSEKYFKLYQILYADALQLNGDKVNAEEIYNNAVLLESPDVKSLFMKMCEIAGELEIELALNIPSDTDKRIMELHQISKLLNNNYFEDKLKMLIS